MKKRSADVVTGFVCGTAGPSSSSSSSRATGGGSGGGGVGDGRGRGRGRDERGGGDDDGHEQQRGSSRRRLRRLLHRSFEPSASAPAASPEDLAAGARNGDDFRSIGAVASANAGASARSAPSTAPAPAAAAPQPSPLTRFSAEHRRRMGGAGSFFEGWIRRIPPPSTNAPVVDVGFDVDCLLIGTSVGYYGRNLHDVSEFLTRHRAMEALMGASSSSEASGGGDGGGNGNEATAASESHVEVYASAVSDFQSAQLALQGSGPGGADDDGTATTMADADRRALAVARRHGRALDFALAHASDDDAGRGTTRRCNPSLLSAADVCHWHSVLCTGYDEDDHAGRYRVEDARDGQTRFPPPDRVHAEMEALIRSLAVLERRWLAPRRDDCGTLHAAAFTAAAMFGLWDVHPFPVGNRVMAGILANWALRRAGVPFPLDPTSGVEELEGAMRATRDNAYLVATTADGRRFEGGIGGHLRGRGVLAPLVRLILDRLAPAAAAFRRTALADRTRGAADEAEARAARRARERAASSGSCAICLDPSPNVAALCCGRELHLNCLAAWLRSNATCVGCRAPLPLLSPGAGPSGTGGGGDRDVDRRPSRRDRYVRGEAMAGLAATGESTGWGGADEMHDFLDPRPRRPASPRGVAVDADDHSVMSDSTGPFRNDESSSVGSVATEVHWHLEEESSSVGSGATEVQVRSLEEESSSVGSGATEVHRHLEEESSSVGSGASGVDWSPEYEAAAEAYHRLLEEDPQLRRRMGYLDDDERNGGTGGGAVSRAGAAGIGAVSSARPMADEADRGRERRRLGTGADGRCGCPRVAGGCRNRAAFDCTNEFCHPCCVLDGLHACARHNVEIEERAGV